MKLPIRRNRCLAVGLALIVPLGLIAALLAGEPATPKQTAAHPPIRYGEHVRPILEKRCVSCHSGRKKRGDLSMETRASLLAGGESGTAIVPGASAKSRLIRAITGADPDLVMPPTGDPLPAEEVAILKLWIDQGALGDDTSETVRATVEAYRAPLAPRRPALPTSPTGIRHPVDRILEAYWNARNIEPGDVVDDRTFLRRASLDLTGLLPEPAALNMFLKDTRSDKRQRLVATLLADRTAYTEHWLSFWNDLLRNDYNGPGYIDGGRKAITGWLYKALHDNTPYDAFVDQLIVPSAGSEGFSYGIKWRGRVNASQVRELQFSQNVSQVFLGINLKCASCHDSFVSDWKLSDAYGLAAIYASRPLELVRCDMPTGKMARPKFLYPELGDVNPEAPREERLRQLADLLTHEKNGRFTRTIVNRLWARLMGRGLVEPVDAMDNEPWSIDLLDTLATTLVDTGYDLKKMLALIATSTAYQRRCAVAREEDEKAFVFRGPRLKRLTAEQFVDAVWKLTATAPQASEAKGAPKPTGGVRASLRKADTLMTSLGRPNREQVVSARPDLLTTLEALELMNGATLAGLLERGANTLLAKYPDGGPALIDDLYARALSRPPSATERQIALARLGAEASAESVADLFWVIFMLPEFQLIH